MYHLKKNGIKLKITYPFPIYKMKPYKKYGSKKILRKLKAGEGERVKQAKLAKAES